jgi:Putative transposase
VHFHTLALDGVFVRSLAGGLVFHAACGPSEAEVAQVLATIRLRVGRLLRRRGLEPGEDCTGPEDPVAEASAALASLVGASVQGRVALGARVGAQVRRLGGGWPPATMGTRGPRHAHLDGFDLHANVWVGPNDRARLEQLCRYVLRPALAEDRLRRLADGRVRVELKRPWSDGTTHLLFEPLELLEKLAALTPRPEINLLLYHGVLAPHARWRPEVVAYRRAEIVKAPDPSATTADAGRGRAGAPRYWTWAALMRRAFDLDVLRCPRCAGRMQLIATIDDLIVIQCILAHLGLPGTRDGPSFPSAVSAAPAEPPVLPSLAP